MQKLDDYDIDVLKDTVFHEARGEIAEGQAAVTYVILQRARLDKSYWGGKKVADVCLKKDEQGNYHFECWKKPERIEKDSVEYQNVVTVVNTIINSIHNNKYSNQDDGCDHYNNPKKEGFPPWTKKCDRRKEIGDHIFYQTKPEFM